MLWLVLILKALIEGVGVLLLARGAVFVLSSGRHEANPVWRMLRTVTLPAEAVTRRVTPRVVLDTHIPLLAFVLCVWVWLTLVVAKVQLLT